MTKQNNRSDTKKQSSPRGKAQQAKTKPVNINNSYKTNQLSIYIVATLSFLTRLYNIHKPDHVCWDETHFGKMASWYINRTFFFDVHPPLGKMMIALSGQLTGYNGSFAFDKPGDQYNHWSQYVGMRIFCATLGLSIPVMIYRATKTMTQSFHAAILAALLLVFDNGMITLTRYILLDPPLLFFISAAILGSAEFSYNSKIETFSTRWWFWLIWTGISLACAFSVKFVGLFIVALVGLRTIFDLWHILGNTSESVVTFFKHLLARALCLIILPIFMYILFFFLHLKLLNHSGNGDGFYSSSFQSQLIGNSLHNSSWPAHLAYGAEVTLKNNRIGGAYLHSHWHLYPEGVGAKQQQVTTYSHKDSNNKWLIKRGVQGDQAKADDIFVRDGDLIRLEHVTTKRNLHSHFEQAPLTKRHYQVTCYGENGIGDANDIWRIQKELSSTRSLTTSDNDDDGRIHTVKTRFRLVHYLTNCALHSHSKQLPKWAYEQMEVTCNPRLFDRNNYWNIEDNYYAKLPNVSFEDYAPSFVEKFIESHAVMLQGNAGLKPKEGEITSRPWQWPLNYKGQFFSASKGQKIYLLGNPLIWWANIATIPLSMLVLIILTLESKIKSSKLLAPEQNKLIDRKQSHSSSELVLQRHLEASSWILLGWCLHYLPFYLMGRVLYFHHYFPAFIFSCMLTASTYDYLATWMSLRLFKMTNEQQLNRRKLELLFILIALIVYTFVKFIPLTYGTQSSDLTSNNEQLKENNNTIESWLSEQQLSSLKWLDSWEF